MRGLAFRSTGQPGNLDSANTANVCKTLSKIASQKIAVLIIVTHSNQKYLDILLRTGEQA